MKIFKYITLLILCLCFSGYAFSKNETLRFRKLNTSDGLNSNVVYALFQDSKGFIWMGTKEGINRYDGYTLRSFPLPSEYFKNIAHQRINSICEDQQGYIWLGTSNGLVQMDAFSGKMIHHALPYQTKASQSQYVNAIVTSDQNDIWVGTRNGLYRYSQQTKKFNQYEHFPFSSKTISYSKGERVINDLCFDAENKLWIATAGNGLTVLDIALKKKRVFKRSKGNNSKLSISSNYIESVFKDSKAVMWLATANGLNRYNPESESFSKYRHSDKNPHSLSDNSIRSITEDLHGQLWVGGKKGLDCFDRETARFYHYQNHPLHPESISSNTILSLLADRSGNFWVGSMQGVNYFNSDKLVFDLYQNIPGEANSLVDNTLRVARVDSTGKIWIGTLKDGINSFDPANGKFRSYRMKSGMKRWRKHNAIRTAYVDKDGKLFFGTDGGVLLYKPEKDRFEIFDAHGKISFKKGVFEIMQDSQASYWFAEIDKGLWKWNPTTAEIHLYKKDSVSGLSSTNLKVIKQRANGDIWIGSHMKGLCRLEKGKNKFRSYKQNKEPGSLSNNRVYAIFEDSNKRLWIGTGKGLNLYHDKVDSFETFGLKDGLSGGVVLSIQEDRLGRLWLGTNRGLSCFDTDKKQVANFYQEDGLQGNIFEYKVACTHPDGQMFFGGNNGLNAFQASDFKMNTFTPNLKFIQATSTRGDLSIHRQEKSQGQVKHKISLLNSDQHVMIDLCSDSYIDAYKNAYAYRILPQDSLWKRLSFSQHQIELPELEVGDYTLEVEVSNNHMKWNPDSSQVHIEVNRDWTQESELLYGLLIALALALIAWLNWFKRKTGDKVNSKQQEKNKKTVKKPAAVKPSIKSNEEWTVPIKELNDLMKDKHLYRDKRLTKAYLASQIQWTEAHLSNTLRDGLQSNFNDYVNGFRVAEIKERLQDPQSRDFTLIAIAEECGFNSKTSFYRIFKKFTDLTPSEYLEKIKSDA